MPTCLVLQHVAAEGPYEIGAALARRGIVLDVRSLYRGDQLPEDVAGFDAVVAMGGPMSAVSDEAFATRQGELALLSEAIRLGRPILGVCLGAQLLAAAAGGEVYAGDHGAEIGWGPVTLTDAARVDPLLTDVAPSLEVLHWHGDTFDLPVGAVLLASSPRYANQAFRLGDHAWGLQFHVEVDEEAVAAFVREFGSDAAAHGAPPAEIAGAAPSALARLAPVRDLVAARFADLVWDRAQLTTNIA